MAFLNRSRPIVHGADRSATIPLIATALLAVIVPLAGCGGQNSSVRFLPGTTARINPIYDVTIFYPDTTLIVGGIPYHGVELDLEFEFDDATVRDDLAPYLADARLLSLRAGGAAQSYELFGPLEIEGTLDGQLFTTGLFGPIRVGTANLIPELIGELSIDRGRIEGDAGLFGTSERGLFTAVKRRRYLVAGSDLLSIGKVALVSVRYDTSFTIEHDLEVVSSDPIVRMEDARSISVSENVVSDSGILSAFSCRFRAVTIISSNTVSSCAAASGAVRSMIGGKLSMHTASTTFPQAEAADPPRLAWGLVGLKRLP